MNHWDYLGMNSVSMVQEYADGGLDGAQGAGADGVAQSFVQSQQTFANWDKERAAFHQIEDALRSGGMTPAQASRVAEQIGQNGLAATVAAYGGTLNNDGTIGGATNMTVSELLAVGPSSGRLPIAEMNRQFAADSSGVGPQLAANGSGLEYLAAIGGLPGSMQRLTPEQIAAIVFNETRSLNGNSTKLAMAYRDLANVIMNGEDVESSSGGKFKRPTTAPTTLKIGNDQGLYDTIYRNVQIAINDRIYEGYDPTMGALNFNLRGNASTGNFQQKNFLPLSTQNGPFSNGYTKGGLPATGVYVNTYYNTYWGPGP